MTEVHGNVFVHLSLTPSQTLIKRQSESPVPAHIVEFVAYGPELMGISLMIPTAPKLLACGLDTDIFGRKQRVLATERD